jgi:hypothetical protein
VGHAEKSEHQQDVHEDKESTGHAGQEPLTGIGCFFKFDLRNKISFDILVQRLAHLAITLKNCKLAKVLHPIGHNLSNQKNIYG